MSDCGGESCDGEFAREDGAEGGEVGADYAHAGFDGEPDYDVTHEVWGLS